MEKVNLKDQLRNLVQLQEIDTQIYALVKEKNSKPEELKKQEDIFAAKKQGLADLDKKMLDLQKKKKDAELEFAAKEESGKKLQGQLFQLKTNKEYQMMLQQIADTKADGSVIEDKILQVMEDMDKLKVEIDKEKLKLQEDEKLFNAQKAKIQSDLKLIEDKLAQLESKRKQVIPIISEKILNQYDRILANRDSLAIVGVKNNSCQGCHMFVPAQEVNLIIMYENIITCGACNRILYVENENA